MTFDFDTILDEALARVGGRTSGYDASAGRRAFALLLTDWANRDVLLWTIEQIVVPVTGARTCVLPVGTIDVAEILFARDGSESPLEKVPRGVYNGIPDKNDAGDPSRFFVNRQKASPVVELHPVPSSGVLKIWRVRPMDDVASLSDEPDMPRRFVPAATSGLAYYLARHRLGEKQTAELVQLVQMLKGDYLEDLASATRADRDTASLHVSIDFGDIWRG